MRLRILIMIFVSISIYAQNNIQELSSNFQSKRYGLAIRQSSVLLSDSFKGILSQSYSYLPYTRSITRSNQNYSLDMQNGRINFNTVLEYIFKYSNTFLKLSLVYSFEEVSYYKAYIENSQYTSTAEELPVYKLNNSVDGSFLWDKSESTAYYVYNFPPTKNNNPVENNIVPGLLLKIQFRQNTAYSPTIQSTMTDIVTNTKWLDLQRLYIVE